MMYLIMGFLADYWWVLAALAVGIAAIANPVAVWKLKAWILLGVVAWWGWTGHSAHSAAKVEMMAKEAAYARGMAEMARAEAELVKQARETERAHAKRLAEIASQHEQDKRDAEATAADTIAGLRAGTIRLRQHWQGCQATSRVSGDAAGAALADAAARLREADAGAAIGDARRADDWIKRLQDAIRAGQSPE